MTAVTPVVAAERGPQLASRRAPAVPRVAILAVIAATLAGGAALRLWQLATKPDWQYDEGVYTTVATNLLRHGTLNEHIQYHTAWAPFLYQPPLYFLGLARWFALTGPSIYHARVLGVVCSMVMLALLATLVWRLHGRAAALFTIVPVTFDGWLLYIERASYMENVLLMLIVAGMLAYQRALTLPSWWRFALAGGLFGFAVCFKYTAAYVILAVLLCWLILRRSHRGHLVLFGVLLAVVAVYVLAMARLFDLPGHDWFLQQNLVQVRRVLGLQKSGGTLTSPAKAIHLLAAQYRVFLPSFAVALASFTVAVRRLWRCYRARNWGPAQGNALLFSWLAAAVVVFGVSSLRFPQYFALILVPMYSFWWTELWSWLRRHRARRIAAVAIAAVAVVAGVVSFAVRVPAQTSNPFQAVQEYAATSLPPHAVVVTEESMGDLISQPWCRVQNATPCLGAASYAITWQTYLQSSFELGDPAFHEMMQGAVPLRSFQGFSGTATVWRLR